jgi:hypothetical protein
MIVVRRLLQHTVFRVIPQTMKIGALTTVKPLYNFAKVSKKKEEKIEKSKEKEQARNKVSNAKEIDLESMEK